ncbi:YcaO-like family protein [Rhizobium sp. C4]|uniref:YcaO-like family protein n=1 Tax=Rhizobium sp. C4 TaxID=1349800 RepID=UPI001E4F445C|nr:YcaO-like family protein [Rhizobium sp. C4]MCD2173642.1 YcaO-like family protein [Rhizobium sp. C4]
MKADRPTSTSAFRACSPEETFARVSPHLSRLGITRVASQTGLDNVGLPVWCAYAPNAKAIVIAQGKGLTDAEARTSAVMEAIERAVATEPACEKVLTCKSALKRGKARFDTVDSLLSSAQPPLGEEEETEWVEAVDLIHGDPVWLPFDAIWFDRTVPRPRYWRSSDGLASGNLRHEARLHGLLERVERDALTLWSIEPARSRFGRRIRPDGAGLLGGARDMLDHIERAGLELALFDITTDLGIASIAALLKPRQTQFLRPLRYVDLTLGAGASLDPVVAAARAISEAVQSRMTFIGGARDDLLPEIFARPADQSSLQAFDAAPVVNCEDLPRLEARSSADGLSLLIEQLRRSNIRKLYAVDLQPAWLPVNVVKVIAPELENPEGDRRQSLGSRAISRSLR